MKHLIHNFCNGTIREIVPFSIVAIWEEKNVQYLISIEISEMGNFKQSIQHELYQEKPFNVYNIQRYGFHIADILSSATLTILHVFLSHHKLLCIQWIRWRGGTSMNSFWSKSNTFKVLIVFMEGSLTVSLILTCRNQYYENTFSFTS